MVFRQESKFVSRRTFLLVQSWKLIASQNSEAPCRLDRKNDAKIREHAKNPASSGIVGPTCFPLRPERPRVDFFHQFRGPETRPNSLILNRSARRPLFSLNPAVTRTNICFEVTLIIIFVLFPPLHFGLGVSLERWMENKTLTDQQIAR